MSEQTWDEYQTYLQRGIDEDNAQVDYDEAWDRQREYLFGVEGKPE